MKILIILGLLSSSAFACRVTPIGEQHLVFKEVINYAESFGLFTRISKLSFGDDEGGRFINVELITKKSTVKSNFYYFIDEKCKVELN